MKKAGKILLVGLMALLLGAIAGAIVWVILRIINLGTDLIWCRSGLVYNLVVCIIGALLIGLWQRKFGILPEETEEVMERIKTEGIYPYDRLHIIAVAVMLPLIFGGTLGPEAGLTGLIAGLCCWIGDSIKRRGDELTALTEAGVAATLGVIFGAPLFGIVGQLEPDNRSEKYREKLLKKKGRIFLYCMGVAGGMLAMSGLGKIFGSGGGLPRFPREHAMGIDQWKWAIPAIAVGIIFAMIYLLFNTITKKLADKIIDKRITSCLIAGVVLAVAGYFVPYTMFSGEHHMDILIEGWQDMAVTRLIMTAIVKLLLVNVCINFGWRGGSIFPIIFSGVAAGYAFALVVGMDGAFAVALVVSAMYAYISRKPAASVAIMLLCVPLTYIAPMIVAAVVAAKVPSPWDRKEIQE